MIFGYYKNYLYTHRYKLSSEKKKKTVKESQYMVSHPGLGSDPPIRSDRDRGVTSWYQSLGLGVSGKAYV